ncbi:hypothetical protein TrRE_jg8694 [Triparma retinervis]|uniref:Uncharacterized protein n=1 Tax=Triparma retinervis TaxID=2557542 RepID=A0A9W6Z644_9STRA|nr:hypothetical protein TrRE_jg8694 [Triparma retinervis]
MGNLVSCVEDNIFNPIESEIVPPSVHAQEEKYRLACEHHQTQVAALAVAQKDVDDLKKKKKKLKSKISEFVGNTSDRKRKLTALERCKLHLAEALEIKAEAKFELDEALKIQNDWVENEKTRRKELSKVLDAEREKKREEEERYNLQQRLDAERAALEKEERLREMRERRHSKEAMLNRELVQEVAPIHPRRTSKKVDTELAQLLEEAEEVILEGRGADAQGGEQEELPLPAPQPQPDTAFPPSSPGESGSTMASPSSVPSNLEASSPADTAHLDQSQQSPKQESDKTKTPQSAPWRKPSKSRLDPATPVSNGNSDTSQTLTEEVAAE